MAMNTPYLSEGTTHYTSNVTIDGALTVGGVATFSGALNSASAISAGALTGTTLKLNGQPVLTLVSASSTSIVALTATATKSTSTTWTDNAVAQGDLVEVGPSSALSAGLVLEAVASAASTITFSYSNVSTANAAQTAINCRYMVWRF